MKNQLLFAFFVLLSFSAFSQYSRSIYSAEANFRRHSSVISDGATTQIVSIRESTNDILRVTLITIDDFGETSNYRMYEYSPFDVSSSFVLSGVGINAAGNATLCVLNPNGAGAMNISYITIDPSTGAFSNYSSENGQYKPGFTRTRVKGDSLITYFAKVNGSGIQRLARSMSSTGLSIEDADLTATYTGSMVQNGIQCELLIDGSTEFIALTSKIIKRTSSNNYIETSYSGFLNAPCLAPTSTGELYVLNRTNEEFARLDINLNTLSSGSVSGLQGIPNGLTEMYALPNNEIRIWTSRNQPIIIDLDANSTIINQQETRNFPLDQLTINGNQYIIGLEGSFISAINPDGIPYQSNPTAITIVSDDFTNEIPDFIEYNQEILTDKIRFQTNHVGQSFINKANVSAGFTFNQNNRERPLIFGSANNTIGTTINGTILGTSYTYEPYTATGPYTSPGNYSMEVLDKYNRGYYVTTEMIESHISEITSGNPAYIIPFGIREWPAHGDVSLGQAANLANFIDQNTNGIYEPKLGDYPAIYGDQCLLNIYHEHPNTANSASIESHQYYFTFGCDVEEAVENAVFVRTHKFSRTQTLFDTYSGNYVDFDLGNFSDDYVGTNVELGMIYAYNADQFDEDANGASGFQDTIPAVGMISLQGVKLDDDGLDNATTIPGGPMSNGIGFSDAISDNEYFTMESSYSSTNSSVGPSGLVDWYNVMQGLNPNGSPKTLNGATIRHDYFGTSDPDFYSSGGIDHGNNNSESGNSNPAGDRRMSCASGPREFSAIDTMVLINAYLVGVDTVNLSPNNSVNRLFEHGQTLRDFFAQNSDACGNTFDVYEAENVLKVEANPIQQIILYPNPANMAFRMRGITGKAHLQIIDLNGRIVAEENDFTDGHEISIQELDNSIYLVSIEDEIGNQVIRLVKR